MLVTWLARLYRALITFYPPQFRAEFGDEMLEVFSRAMDDARGKGVFALLSLAVGELFSFPLAAARAWRGAPTRRYLLTEMPSVKANLFHHPWQELVFALAMFLLPAGILLTLPYQQVSTAGNLWAVFLFMMVMLLIGWLGGLPLWSIPYIGLVLSVAGYLYLFQWIASLVTSSLISNFSPGPWDPSSFLILRIASTGMLWLMIFCLTLLIVALLMVLNRFQSLLGRIRHDWTILSYILYGESIFALLILFRNQRLEGNYIAAGILCLWAGIWFYLRSKAPWGRLLALIGCLTLAMGIAVLHQWPAGTGNAWLSWSNLLPTQAGRLLVSWAWMVAVLLLPGWLARLPARRALQQ